MGLKFTDIERNLGNYLPNASRCGTWGDVKASHKNKDHYMVLNYDDIYGLLIILAVGLFATLIIFIAEIVMKRLK